MAFQSSAQSQNVAPFGQPAGQNNRQRGEAAGFINLYLPTTGGGRKKLGYIVLSASNEYEAKLAERLKTDPVNALKKLNELIEVEFNDGQTHEENHFAI